MEEEIHTFSKYTDRFSIYGCKMKEKVKTREQIISELRQLFQSRKGSYSAIIGKETQSSRNTTLTIECETTHPNDKRLLEDYKQFRNIAELSPFPMSIIDSRGQFLYVNQKFVEIFGYTLEDIPHEEKWFRLAHPDPEYRRQVISAWTSERETTRDNRVRPQEYSVRCKDGKERDIIFRTVSLENGKKFITYEDHTEREQDKKQLQETLEKLRKALGGAIHAIALIVEKRDAYTAGHQRRVADLARAIATEMGLSISKIDGIRMAGVIHDLGKVAVPSEILSKPDRLNGHEVGLIRTHPQVGYGILKEIDFPWPVAQIVLQHHERIDGSGYPQGLRGSDILVEAKIIAVADVVEAMASHRPYRPALGIKKALEEITRYKGIRYENTIVETCCELFSKNRFVWK